jgi:hypothetical protein
VSKGISTKSAQVAQAGFKSAHPRIRLERELLRSKDGTRKYSCQNSDVRLLVLMLIIGISILTRDIALLAISALLRSMRFWLLLLPVLQKLLYIDKNP